MRSAALLALLGGLASVAAAASGIPAPLLSELRWRSIGPFRGGRTVAAAGVPGRPGLFYIGVNNGGVWRSDDYGRVWRPIFDEQPTGSIGALAVAPSDPRVIYAASGEGLHRPDLSTGDGIYLSTDGGATWEHGGLRDGQQIPALAVDPRDPNRLFAAVLGHPYGPNEERGIFRSSDGGRTFAKVLYRDADTGGIDVALDPADPDAVYAALWEAREAPWEDGEFAGPGSGLFKSTDGGTTWRPVGNGLPTAADGLGRIGLGTCPSAPRRLYAIVGATTRGGLYRSDDAGESWRRVNDDPRLWERDGDFNEVRADPTDADTVYVANVVAWKSTDGGATFTAWRGAPGGDDYHRVWIDPRDPRVVLLASDQGAIVTVNGGATWSSWYNQPTAQMFHVAADRAFPYRLCGGQQESGSACVASRGAWGRVTVRDWATVGADEYATVAPDPLDPEVVYGGRVSRFDRRTGQSQSVGPRPLRGGDYRILRTAPLLFSPLDPHTLYFASERVWKTSDGGRHWQAVSPDLARPEWAVPANVGKYASSEAARSSRRGVVYALGLSPLDAGVIWAGTDDGLIHRTTDGGGSWQNVTPPALVPWAKVSSLEASHFDRDTAYAAINTLRLDDLAPHVLRTRDGGRTWQPIVEGIPGGGTLNVVREDPQRRGLLFAGSEREIYVSFDDGERWQSLRGNLPATSIRDLIVKDDDLAVATHGRGFWILGDITPLRELDARVVAADRYLFRPAPAWRVRNNVNTDTPLPPDEPGGENPPEGAIVDYLLGRPAAGAVVLEVLDGAGEIVRRYASDDPVVEPVAGRNLPDYWLRPPRRLATAPGLHRFVWDLRYAPPAGAEAGYPMAAVPGDTPRLPQGPWVLPGEYRLRLTVAGKRLEQPLVVRMDPRVASTGEDLAAQLRLSRALAKALDEIQRALDRIAALRAAIAERNAMPIAPELRSALASCDRELAAAAEGESGTPGLSRLLAQHERLYSIVQGADAAPTPQAETAAAELAPRLRTALDGAAAIAAQRLPALDAQLRRAGLAPLPPPVP